MQSVYKSALLFFIVVLSFSCSKTILVKNTKYEVQEISINNTLASDSTIVAMISPNKRILDSLMNEVIAVSEEELIKEKPNGTLNNFCADMMLQIAKQQEPSAEICIINYGGIRLSALPKGNITIGKIYELMPFDNMIVTQKIKGNVLQEVLNYVATQGGWPVSGIQMEIQNKKATNIKINGTALDNEKLYTLVVSDYIANGGDNLTMLKTIPQNATNLIMREAFIKEIKKTHQIIINHEKRIHHVD